MLALLRAGLMSFWGGGSKTRWFEWYFLPAVMFISQWNDKSCKGFHTFFPFYFSHGKCVVTRTPEDNEAGSWATIASHIFLLHSHSLDQHRLLCPRFLPALFHPASVVQILRLELVSGNYICRVPCGQLNYPVLCLIRGSANGGNVIRRQAFLQSATSCEENAASVSPRSVKVCGSASCCSGDGGRSLAAWLVCAKTLLSPFHLFVLENKSILHIPAPRGVTQLLNSR